MNAKKKDTKVETSSACVCNENKGVGIPIFLDSLYLEPLRGINIKLTTNTVIEKGCNLENG